MYYNVFAHNTKIGDKKPWYIFKELGKLDIEMLITLHTATNQLPQRACVNGWVLLLMMSDDASHGLIV